MLKISFENPDEIVKICHALSTKIRVDILKLLRSENLSVVDISNRLNIPFSTASSNINILEKAGLILTELHPGKRGVIKICSKNFFDVLINLNNTNFNLLDNKQSISVEMPIGQFINYAIEGSCGMASSKEIITEDNPDDFFTPDRIHASLLWLRKGFIEYKFPKKNIPKDNYIYCLELSLELCSEAPNFNDNWPSDISFIINNKEVAIWTSPGDFGSKRGALNPEWWPDTSTQYGILKHLKINEQATFIDEIKVSDITIHELNLQEYNFIDFKIAIKDDAINKGGFNLFGKDFGNYNQDIILKAFYKD